MKCIALAGDGYDGAWCVFVCLGAFFLVIFIWVCFFLVLFVAVGAQPTDVEMPVYTHVEAVLKKADTILQELGAYRGASNEIRDVSLKMIALVVQC